MNGARQHDIVKPDRLWAVAICTPAIRFVSNVGRKTDDVLPDILERHQRGINRYAED
ncbi:MAG: hypothetical protein AB1342_06015 [Pseudomonadota bacterium]